MFISLSVQHCVTSCLQKLDFITQAQSCIFLSLRVVSFDIMYKVKICKLNSSVTGGTSHVVGTAGMLFVYEWLDLALYTASKYC